MAWGAQRRGLDDLAERLAANDPSLASLCVLRLRRVDEAGCCQLAAALGANTVLRELSLASHAVPPAAAAAFAQALAANTTLRSLDLGDRSFGDEGLAALAPGIAASASLTSLNLEAKGLSAAGCAALAAAVSGAAWSADAAGLQELLLGQNALGGEGLAALLQGPLCARLTSLDLTACGLEGAPGVQPLAAALQQGRLPQLRSLRLDGNELGAAGAAELAAALGSAGCALQQLHLQRCGLGPEAATALAPALPASLAALDLSGNALGLEGATALAATLADGAVPQLAKLLLCGCSLDGAAMAALADALPRDGTASAAAGLTLDLSGNAAGADAAAALAAAPLASLCLHDCQLGRGSAAAAAALAAHLQAPGTFAWLAELDLSANHLESAALLPLLEALTTSAAAGDGDDGSGAACPHLRLLVIAANPGAAGDDTTAAVERLQEARPGLDVVRRAADTGEGGMMAPGGFRNGLSQAAAAAP